MLSKFGKFGRICNGVSLVRWHVLVSRHNNIAPTRLGHPPLLSPLAAVVRGVSALLNLDFDYPLVNIQKLKSFMLVFVG